MNRRAQSSNIGLVLLLALTITGAGVVVAVGSSALEDVQDRTSIDRAEHAMTLFDARMATVGLGEDSVQTVRLGRGGSGDYAVDSDTGWLRIEHENYTAGERETVYNATLGSVSYRTAGTEVAYQGGGVWRQQDGGTSMVSPPEFHYRGTTLTLPVLRVRSTDAATGATTATIRRDGALGRVFPNDAATYSETGEPYVNPLRNGTASVTVHSRYYEGWADYFRSRTTGNVSVDDASRTVTVVLETTDIAGPFEYPAKDESVPVRGIEPGHSVTEFETAIEKDKGTFNNLYVSFYIEEGEKAYEAGVELPSGGVSGNYCQDGEPSSEELTMDVYYDDAATEKGVHRWSNDSIPSDSGDVQLDCTEDDDTVIRIDFTGTEQTFTYGESNVDEETAIDWDERNESATEKPDPITFGHIGEDNESTTYDYGDEQNSRILTRHYFATFGSDFDVRVFHAPGDRGTTQIDSTASGGTLQYDRVGGGEYITYLHVTENNVTVELN